MVDSRFYQNRERLPVADSRFYQNRERLPVVDSRFCQNFKTSEATVLGFSEIGVPWLMATARSRRARAAGEGEDVVGGG